MDRTDEGGRAVNAREVMALFDAAAEAMILVDPTDTESTAQLVGRLTELRDALGAAADQAHPASVAVACALRVADGDATALEGLDRHYSAARALAEKAVREVAAGQTASSAKGARKTAQKPTEPESVMPLAGDEDLLRDFVVRAAEHLDDADEQLLALEGDAQNHDAVDAVFRAFHTIKGMAGFLALDDISEHAHSSESLLAEARTNRTAVADEVTHALFSAVDRMRALISQAAGTATDVEKTGQLGEVSVVAGRKDSELSARTAISSGREGTVRVEEQRLDRLLDTIGEMVIAESMVSAALRNGLDTTSVAVQLDRLDKITRELQQMATSLRMVPLRATFRRMSRLVRDVAHKGGKQIEFVTFGEDTELDKEVVDRIADPLIHALRNAVDHGIESAEERVAAGKSPVGRVELSASHTGGAIHIEIRDDGRGLDAVRIIETARERGLLAPDAALDDRSIFDLVYAPGFSTADEVTDVSGRGVGMDVVRRTVDELRGRIELESEPGMGTTVSVRLPITLAIIDGMVARVGTERYVVPILAIERSVRPTPEQIATVHGAGEMLVTDEGLVPIVRLHRHFSTPDAEQDPTQAVVIITSDSGARAGLMACELLGQQQTVIKPLGDGIPDQRGITGGAIMPDGQVGLILDAAGLVRLARDRNEAPGGVSVLEGK
jgi:two-component system chemotaxis sensor kinase CheA